MEENRKDFLIYQLLCYVSEIVNDDREYLAVLKKLGFNEEELQEQMAEMDLED